MPRIRDSFIDIEVRPGIQIPAGPPIGPGGSSGRGPPPPPGPGWNGIPGTPGGSCEDNLLVNLTITLDFESMMQALDKCQEWRARDAAREEIEKLRNDDPNGIEPHSGLPLNQISPDSNPPEELVEKHLRILRNKGYENCGKDFLCPILERAQVHHKRCRHKMIEIHVPRQLIQEIEEWDCWKRFVKFLEDDGVDWMPLPV